MKTIWLNLPVKDIQKSKAFFKAIGFRENPIHKSASDLGSFLIGEHDFVMMLFQEETFQSFTQNNVSDTKNGTEVLINIDAQSKEEVDAFASIVKEAGGEVFSEPAEVDSWMYTFGFKDVDGHRWSMLYMNMEKIPE
ncbi:VOC family protein [Aquimarina celericrescens]|uniref:VOC family protein n=1 Tax=Aquimarina celericrescens TaxID=1964542 RepID=A0ABW5AWF2_9FLAO|nr:VOC family protein [Aquimarina celericrescens]